MNHHTRRQRVLDLMAAANRLDQYLMLADHRADGVAQAVRSHCLLVVIALQNEHPLVRIHCKRVSRMCADHPVGPLRGELQQLLHLLGELF